MQSVFNAETLRHKDAKEKVRGKKTFRQVLFATLRLCVEIFRP